MLLVANQMDHAWVQIDKGFLPTGYIIIEKMKMYRHAHIKCTCWSIIRCVNGKLHLPVSQGCLLLPPETILITNFQMSSTHFHKKQHKQTNLYYKWTRCLLLKWTIKKNNKLKVFEIHMPKGYCCQTWTQ